MTKIDKNFKPGDIVKCINAEGLLLIKVGNIYVIEQIRPFVGARDFTIKLKGINSCYSKTRFELITGEMAKVLYG